MYAQGNSADTNSIITHGVCPVMLRSPHEVAHCAKHHIHPCSKNQELVAGSSPSAGLCWQPVGRWFPTSPSFKESPCSRAQGELQVVPGFRKTFANKIITFLLFSIIIFYYYFPNSTSQGWYHATHNQCVSATHYLHLPFTRCSLTQEISKASRSKRGGWLCTKCIHVLQVTGKTSIQRKRVLKVL